jgi:ERCC4-type nuclease
VSDTAPHPLVVLVDDREKRPYTFSRLRGDARDGYATPAVETRRVALPTGDYSLEGLADRVTVERKSLADLYGTLGRRRARFQDELARLNAMDAAFVVVEADWRAILRSPPPHSRLSPKSVFRSVVAWQQRFPRVHWWACPNRAFAEVATARILQRYFRDRAGR